MAAYRLASLNAPEGDPRNIRRQAADRLRKAPTRITPKRSGCHSTAFASSSNKDVAAAAVSLERAIAINGRDPIAHYRYGRVLEARRQDARR
jgi:hypothetical protein